MSIVRCPGCGRPTFTVRGWASADHCPRCGSPLELTEQRARPDDRALELEVQNRLYGAERDSSRNRRHQRRRGATRGSRSPAAPRRTPSR